MVKAKIKGQDTGKKIATLLLVVASLAFGLREITTRIINRPVDNVIKLEQKPTPSLIAEEIIINSKNKDKIAGLKYIQTLTSQLEKIIADTRKLVEKQKYQEAVNSIQKLYEVENKIDQTRESLYSKKLITAWEDFEIGDKLGKTKVKLGILIDDIRDILGKDNYLDRYLSNPNDTVSLIISSCQRIFTFDPLIGDFNSNINLKKTNGKTDKLKFEFNGKNHTFRVDSGQIKNPNIVVNLTENFAKNFVFSKEPNEQLRAALKNGTLRYDINKRWLVEHGKLVMNTNLDLMVGNAKSLIGDFTANFKFKRLNGNIDKITLVFEDEKIKTFDYGETEDSDIDILVDEKTIIDITLSKDPKSELTRALKNHDISLK